ncbi:MAG: SRPBCC domain-containing protein [Streptosporangiales bacterium]|nr:SRPBCC domain-containing protein [Streptosporangiales bacterium]
MPTGLTKDAGWQIGVSRTLAHPPAAVWEFITSPAGLELWLGPGAELTPERGAAYRTTTGVAGEVRSYHPGERVRITYGDTTVQVTVTPAISGAGAVLRFHQERLSDAEERERQRAHWQQVMTAVATTLDEQ